MLIEEEEPKIGGDINPDALEEVFDGDVTIDEEVTVFVTNREDEDADDLDLAFQDEEGYW